MNSPKYTINVQYQTQNTMCNVLICLILLCRNRRLLLWIMFVSYPTVNMIRIRWWGISLRIKFPYPRWLPTTWFPFPFPFLFPLIYVAPLLCCSHSHGISTGSFGPVRIPIVCTGEECWFWHNVYISQTMPLSLWCINFCVYSLINAAFVTIVQRYRSLMNIQRLLAMNIVSVTVKCDCQLLWLCCCSL